MLVCCRSMIFEGMEVSEVDDKKRPMKNIIFLESGWRIEWREKRYQNMQ
jgi:hypothetical protein